MWLFRRGRSRDSTARAGPACGAWAVSAAQSGTAPARERILNGIGQRMAKMERARDIGWRDHNREVGRLGSSALERLFALQCASMELHKPATHLVVLWAEEALPHQPRTTPGPPA